MRGFKTYIKMKINKVFRHGEEYFKGHHVHLKNVKLGYRCNLAYESDLMNATVGKRTSVGRYTTVRTCTIGNYCAISWNCSLGAKNHHYEMGSCSGAFFHSRFGLVDNDIKKMDETPETIIGNDVWIGCNAVVSSGVTIGDGAIVGAGAVVTKDVEPYSIVVGVPAKCIGYRFEKEICENLLKAKWWLWDDKLLKDNIPLFQCEMTKEISEKLLEVGKE